MREAARASALAPSRDASPTTVLHYIESHILTAPSRRDALGKLLAEQLRVDTRRRAHRVRRTLGRARSARTVRRGDACAEARGSCSASKLGVILALLHTSRRPHREQSTERVSRPSAYLVGRPAISFARPTWRGAAGMESCGLGKKCDVVSRNSKRIYEGPVHVSSVTAARAAGGPPWRERGGGGSEPTDLARPLHPRHERRLNRATRGLSGGRG